MITFGIILGWRRELLVMFLLSMLLNSLLTHSIKYLIRRRRPRGGTRSFPSGHTAISVHCAAVMALHISVLTSLPLLMMAAFVGTSRVIARKHYISDVIGGALLGILTASLLPRLDTLIP